jgi:hypothetical protein
MGGITHTFAYQWQRDNLGSGSYSNIGGANANTYVLVNADDACHVRCVVTATNDAGSTAQNSNALGTVIESGIPVNSVAPVVSGTAPQGSTLSASTGTWSNLGGNVVSFAYQWTRDGVNIGGATSSTYITQASDLGHAIGCKVAATNTAGSAAAVASSNTITVTAPPPPLKTSGTQDIFWFAGGASARRE